MFYGDEYCETCGQVIDVWLRSRLRASKVKESAPSASTNKSSPKLPKFEEILNGCQPPFGKQSSKNYISGMRYMYNFIAGKIGL